MAIYKFRSFEEAERANWKFNPDAVYYRRLRELWEFADRLNSIKYPKGLYKYNSLDDAAKEREAWEMAHAIERHLGS